MSDGRYVSTGFGPVYSAVGIFEPVTITRSISAVLDTGTGEGFWPDAIDADKSAAPAPTAKATPTQPGLTWGFISDPKTVLGFFIRVIRGQISTVFPRRVFGKQDRLAKGPRSDRA